MRPIVLLTAVILAGAASLAARATPPDCAPPADCSVGVTDLLRVLADWGAAGSPCDVDEDGVVGVGDLLAVLGGWGPFDLDPPSFLACPDDVVIPADRRCAASLPDLRGGVIARDLCDPDLAVAQMPPPGTPLPLGAPLVTYEVADAAGNTAFCTSLVHVTDDAPPQIVFCPLPFQLEADVSCLGSLPDLRHLLLALDACDDELDVEQDPPPGLLVPDGTEVVFTAIDDAGNTSTCVALVELLDVTPPIILVCPPPIVVPGGIPDLRGQLVAIDSCTGPGALDVQQVPPAAAVSPGTYSIQFVVTDEAGNVATCVTTVVVPF